jgi:hypothetical protein
VGNPDENLAHVVGHHHWEVAVETLGWLLATQWNIQARDLLGIVLCEALLRWLLDQAVSVVPPSLLTHPPLSNFLLKNNTQTNSSFNSIVIIYYQENAYTVS